MNDRLLFLLAICLLSLLEASEAFSFPRIKRRLLAEAPHSRLSMSTNEIKVVPKASEEAIAKLRAKSWPTWGCDVSKFPWTYGENETCLLLKGKVTVTPTDGRAPVTIEAGDICTFPAGVRIFLSLLM
jgi:uncharacterized cupin superfamily protein